MVSDKGDDFLAGAKVAAEITKRIAGNFGANQRMFGRAGATSFWIDRGGLRFARIVKERGEENAVEPKQLRGQSGCPSRYCANVEAIETIDACSTRDSVG